MAPPIRDGLTHDDSVMGSSHDHTLYMIYRAYPQYVINTNVYFHHDELIQTTRYVILRYYHLFCYIM